MILFDIGPTIILGFLPLNGGTNESQLGDFKVELTEFAAFESGQLKTGSHCGIRRSVLEEEESESILTM